MIGEGLLLPQRLLTLFQRDGRRCHISTARNHMITSRAYLIPLLVFVAINALHLLGLKVYEPWLQVILLWTHHLDVADLAGNFHFSRLMVTVPGLWLEDRWPGHGFSTYVSIFLLLCSVLFLNLVSSVPAFSSDEWARCHRVGRLAVVCARLPARIV